MRIPPPSADLDADLIRIGRENPGFRIERDGDGTIVLSPVGGFGGARSFRAAAQLAAFAERAGGTVFAASQGWRLRDAGGNDVVRCPDASWLSQERVDAVPHAERAAWRILRVCPDVAVEVKSPSDDWAQAIAKLDLYVANGARYALAVDPESRRVVERGVPPPGLHLDIDAIAG